MLEKIKNEINKINNKLINIRRYLHENAEIGFDLKKTTKYIKSILEEYEYTIVPCGKSGFYTDINIGAKTTILLRADMDALPIKEETDLVFKSKKNMHACGHDIHATALIGAAIILSKNKDKLCHNVRFMFQPAEELLKGAKDMINSNVLVGVDYAFMQHILTKTKYKTGTIIVNKSENCAPSCDYINVVVKGKSCHGAIPKDGINPILITTDFINCIGYTLQKETDASDNVILTFTGIKSGDSYNIIPNSVTLKGSVRCFSEAIRKKIKERLEEIREELGKKYNTEITITYPAQAPVFKNDLNLLSNTIDTICKEFQIIDINNTFSKSKQAGSEDFAYVSQLVPTVMFSVCAGEEAEGYCYPLHNEKMMIDENVIYYSTLLNVMLAIKK